MKVNIITPIRAGGPYYSGQNLAKVLNERGIMAIWTHHLAKVLFSPIWQSADIVHSMDIPIGYRLWRKPLVLTIKGEYPIEKTPWQSFYPRAIKKATIITIPSHYLKERLNLNDAVVIPNAIFPERFKQVKHTAKNVISLVTVINFSFADKAEGILHILGILDHLFSESDQKVKYSVVGDGPYLSQIKEESAAKHNFAVEFKGRLTNPAELLAESDVFLYYSHHDNFPNVILEAMACGLPVITNPVGAVSEIIEHEKDGYVAPPDEAYGEYLLNLIKSPELRNKIGQNARKSVETKFNLSKMVDRYIEIYRKVL